MSLGRNIKQLREQKQWTQQQLANELNVTPQAVSRWETNQVEPSIETLKLMSTLFEVSLDHLIGSKENALLIESREAPNNEPQIIKQMIGKCVSCGKMIYADDVGYRKLVRGHRGNKYEVIKCAACLKKEEEARARRLVELNKKARIKGFIFGGLLALLTLVIGIVSVVEAAGTGLVGNIIFVVIISYAAFAFIFNLFAKNNAVGDIFLKVVSFGFVRMPGIIFSLSLDGIIWLITVKLFLAIISFLLGVLSTILAIVVGGFVSMFIFPSALARSLHKPELYTGLL